tara:strand:+ start:776 stop:997 length:222 start_codon:yes stop_codon:yes gene_type:complete
MSNKAFFDDYYGQLKGFQIVAYKMEEEEDEFGYREFPTFILQRGQQQIKIVVSQDEEGNDGGFLFVEESEEIV